MSNGKASEVPMLLVLDREEHRVAQQLTVFTLIEEEP